ncbi:uncharacterized protein LOC111797743 isoform X2 [Cucurbita pepo subsp. pepo]|uniref:uncharacterized protein LOC111797743 isoform X2 n=1 Tax=Cucurbita pepo subsp. pepo TaxID=3664 RepID=UPI000C9D7F49|nr:uncharacterized protein LOC111797743 isoform X2 [Cucurbita pepo subsp. pepo]
MSLQRHVSSTAVFVQCHKFSREIETETFSQALESEWCYWSRRPPLIRGLVAGTFTRVRSNYVTSLVILLLMVLFVLVKGFSHALCSAILLPPLAPCSTGLGVRVFDDGWRREEKHFMNIASLGIIYLLLILSLAMEDQCYYNLFLCGSYLCGAYLMGNC